MARRTYRARRTKPEEIWYAAIIWAFAAFFAGCIFAPLFI